MEHHLKQYFGFSKFRHFQQEVIQKVLEGQDCLVVMATGSGKSLCYQLPPLISKKSAVVISPLISLMQDQVMGLKQRGIKSEYMSSAQRDSSVTAKAREGQYDVLFMTPEKALGLPDSFWKCLTSKGVSLLAVDEAHCISEWGHDFRTDYQQLQKLRRVLPKTPIVALTATATERVRFDIKKSLNLANVFEVVSTFDRPNLFYAVKFINRTHAFREELAQEVMKDCQSGGSTIIYCTTVKDVEEMTETLAQSGVDAGRYHGQMNQWDREAAHSSFARDELQIIVATVAFGMGIDKPDIRRVIHYGCPKSLESYYQESGRCGRDGLPSSCWLYYTRSDFAKADFYAAEAQTEARRKVVIDVFQAAERYCKTSTCRRKFILEYFGEMAAFENCGNCDNCTSSKNVEGRDMSEETLLLLSSVDLCGGRFGINIPIDALRGSRAKKILENKFDELPLYGLGASKTSNWWKALGDELLANGYLTETRRDIYRFISVGAPGKRFLQNASSKKVPVMILPTQEMLEEESKKGGLPKIEGASCNEQETTSKYLMQSMSQAEVMLCESLLKERANLAKKNNTAPYAICSEVTIQNLAKVRPSSRARLLNVDGVNQWLVGKHGDEILKAIKQLSTELGLHLDSEAKTQTETQTVPNSNKSNQGDEIKATPAKIEAWRMWQEEGMTISQIANLPDRPKPIRDETVVGYIMDCCRLGFELDWQRFSKETGFDGKVAKEVQAGIERAGARNLLKPIKEQVPEYVSYLHIKIFLMMQDLQLPDPSISTEGIKQEILSDYEEASAVDTEAKRIQKTPVEPVVTENFGVKEAKDGSHASEEHHAESSQGEAGLPWSDENSSFPSRQKRAPMWRRDTDRYSKWARRQELTEECLMEWLSEKQNGGTIQAMLCAFSTDEDSLLALLTKLEEDFLIYKKDDLYRII